MNQYKISLYKSNKDHCSYHAKLIIFECEASNETGAVQKAKKKYPRCGINKVEKM